MLCNVCEEREATIHLTQMLNGEIKKLHLCEECAEQSGINVHGPMSLTEVVSAMGAPQESTPEDDGKACRRCGMKRSDFRKGSRLGCPACYEVFSEELAPLLAGMHRSAQHVGKVPRSEAAAGEMTAEMEAVQKRLKEAVSAEQYEEAARLRDLLQAEKRKACAGKARRRVSDDGG